VILEIIGFIAGVLGVIGVVLNNYKLIWCFPLWLVGNALSAGIHVYTGVYTMALRDAAFFVLSIHGWRHWRKKQ